MDKYASEEILDFAARAGHVLLENGAEISRVESTMDRIVRHYGESEHNFFVLSNGIFTTGRSYAHTEFIPIKGARLSKVVAVNQLSREICSCDIPLPEARERLSRIQEMPAKPLWEQTLGAAFGCAGFCAIFGGSLLDCAAVLFTGMLLNLFVLFVCAPYMSKILGNICAGALGTLMCIALHLSGLGVDLGNIIVGTLILLIPGVPFTNGLRDIGNEDYIAGTTRLLDSLMVFLCIAVGVCFAFVAHSWVSGGVIPLSGTVTDPLTAVLPLQLAAALIGTYSFAILFDVPRKFYLPCGIVGMLGWLVYLLSVRCMGASAFGATFLSAVVVALLTRVASVKLRCPNTVFLICGIFPLIPGAGVFWCTYYTVSGQFPLAVQAGTSALKVTLAIVLGIIITANIFLRKQASGNRLR